MKFRVDITETAKNDIIEAAEYLDYVLKNPQAADNLMEAVEKETGSLTVFRKDMQFWTTAFRVPSMSGS